MRKDQTTGLIYSHWHGNTAEKNGLTIQGKYKEKVSPFIKMIEFAGYGGDIFVRCSKNTDCTANLVFCMSSARSFLRPDHTGKWHSKVTIYLQG